MMIMMMRGGDVGCAGRAGSVRPLRGQRRCRTLKRRVYNQDKSGVGWKTLVSVGLGYSKPFS